jgi:hypothetical protein
MDYFFYNTDARAIREKPRPRFPVLIKGGFAAAGGDRKNYGEQLGQLAPDDLLLMYENRVGVVAIGRVLERWDGVSYATPQYYKPGELSGLDGGPHEYRIAVRWFHDLSANPITLDDLRKRFGARGFAPRGTVKKIEKYRVKVEQLLTEVQPTPIPTPAAIDLTVPPPERVETTTYRILRDTPKALRVKQLHKYQCQVCGHTIELSDGTRYAEAHHIQPLGNPHNGPDVAENILCLCPNHHAACDLGAIQLRLRKLRQVRSHVVHTRYIEYHNRVLYRGGDK